MNKKAIVFDMDECIGSFWSLWPFYDLYLNDNVNNLDKLLDFCVKYVLPTCLRPSIKKVFKFLEKIKQTKQIGNIFIYTNNGNYTIVKQQNKEKFTFPHFVIRGIEKYTNTPGLFDLIFETIFIRKKDAKNNIKNKYISDISQHGYTNINNILIFDDKTKVWINGRERVIQIPPYVGGSHCYLNINKLVEKFIKANIIIDYNKQNKLYLIDIFNNLIKEEDYFKTDLNDDISIKVILPSIKKFIS